MTRKAKVFFNNNYAGLFVEEDNFTGYTFTYLPHYQGPPISLTMPLQQASYHFTQFPPFFDGLLPEGAQLDALLRQTKLDRYDYFGQLVAVGADLVGAITMVKEE